MIDIVRSVGWNIFRTFGWRRWFLADRARGGCVAGIFRLQTLLERLISSCSLGGRRAGWQERKAEQTEGDFDFHG
jgi:hypothetical protein